jgi:exodeoxyribonuclease V alpha subunit
MTLRATIPEGFSLVTSGAPPPAIPAVSAVSSIPAAGTRVECAGHVERVFYSAPRYTAGLLHTDDGQRVKFAVKAFLQAGNRVEIAGIWEDSKYGRQLQVKKLVSGDAATFTPKGLAAYLTYLPVEGLGPVRAGKLVEVFGLGLPAKLQESPVEVAEACGLPVALVTSLAASWKKNDDRNETSAWLAGCELTAHQITTLVNNFGDSLPSIIRENPYMIVRAIRGFGFKRIDEIALKTGMDPRSPTRALAAVSYVVLQALDNDGHTWLTRRDVARAVKELLGQDAIDVGEAIDGAVADGEVVIVRHDGHDLIALPYIHQRETSLMRTFEHGSWPNPHFAGKDAGALVDALGLELPLNEDQRSAVIAATSHTMTLISGGAGSGKTFTITAIVKLYEELGLTVELAAPTGRAAKRIEEVVKRPAQTLHRLLGSNGRTFYHEDDVRFARARAAEREASSITSDGDDDDRIVDADVLIVDELSMVDIDLAWHLFESVDLSKTMVVFVGDHNQLPPVGPGNLLRDLIARQPIPTIILRTIMRQSGPLAENSTAILAGEVRPSIPLVTLGETPPAEFTPWWVRGDFAEAGAGRRYILGLYQDVLAERLGFDILKGVQLLSPMKKGVLGTDGMNRALQALIQKKLWGVTVEPETLEDSDKPPRLLPHDRVIQTENNYQLGPMNGSIGVVSWVNDEEMAIEFEDFGSTVYPKAFWHQLSLAYALTVHKAQGGEFPCVVSVVHSSHSRMHDRNLFYTSVTRAQKTSVVVGNWKGILPAAKMMKVGLRQTFFSILPMDGDAAPGKGLKLKKEQTRAGAGAPRAPEGLFDD